MYKLRIKKSFQQQSRFFDPETPTTPVPPAQALMFIMYGLATTTPQLSRGSRVSGAPRANGGGPLSALGQSQVCLLPGVAILT